MLASHRHGRPFASAALLCGVAGLLAACEAASPGEALWPTVAFQPADTWQPAIAAAPAAWWQDRIAVSAGTVDDRPATLLENLDTDRAVTVHYLDGSGVRQSIEVPAGGSVGVAAPPAEVIAID